MAIAEISNLTVKYGDKVAVDNVSCVVPDGCIGLLGPNGAGKTTLIKAMLGFLEPSAGSGRVLGYDMMTEPLMVRLNVGLMPEMDCHIPAMTAVEYVAFCGELSGMPREHSMRRAHEVLDYVGLSEARYRPIESYSTGMRQRAKLAQALVHGPRLLFLDEPTNGMDPAGRDEILGLIKDVSHGKGVNIIVSSHLLPDIERTCDYIIVMSNGKIRAEQTVTKIREVSATQWDVELKVPVDAFIQAITERKGLVLSSFSNIYRVEFPVDVTNPSAEAFQAAKSCGGQIRRFIRAQKSLEDAFMEAIQ